MEPMITITLRLSRLLSGSTIMEMVEAVAEGNFTYVQQAQPDGSLLVGQSSALPYNHVAVVASPQKLGLSPKEGYDRVTIMSHDFGGSTGDYTDAQVATAVYAFAQQLTDNLLRHDSYREQTRRMAASI